MQHNNNNDGIYSILGVVMVSFNLVIPSVVVLKSTNTQFLTAINKS